MGSIPIISTLRLIPINWDSLSVNTILIFNAESKYPELVEGHQKEKINFLNTKSLEEYQLDGLLLEKDRSRE